MRARCATVIVALVLLAMAALPESSASFTGTTGTTGSFAAGTLAAPTGLSNSRPCGAQAPTLKGQTVMQSGAGATSMVVTTPSAAIADVLIAWAVSGNTTSVSVSGSGWNGIGSRPFGSSIIAGFYLPLSSAGPAASYTFSWASGRATVVLQSYTAVDQYTPVPVTGSPTGGTGTTATSPTMSAARAGGLVVTAAGVIAAPTLSDPSGATARATTATTDGVVGMKVWDAPRAATGTTPAYTSTWTGSQAWGMLAAYVQPPTTAPKDPTVTLSWTAAASPPAAGYTVARNDGQTFTVSGGTSTGYVDSSGVAATAYTYTVRSTAGSTWVSATSVNTSAAACP